MHRIDFTRVTSALSTSELVPGGRVQRVVGTTIGAALPSCQVGSIFRIRSSGPERLAEVIGFDRGETLLAAFDDTKGIEPGDVLTPIGLTDQQELSPSLLGRTIDALGRPIDQGGPLPSGTPVSLYRPAPNPMSRVPVHGILGTGVRALDVLTTVGKGQRLGIFAGPGVGKSTLLGMLSRNSEADIRVLALVGERGREVRNFLERELPPEAAKRTVTIVATGEAAPILRVRCAFLATAVAEYFRDLGHNVLFLMDSVTRLAHALREVGLSAGEPPATRGYPPSVYSTLPKLLERAGNGASSGTMTAFYTVLVEGDDLTDPIADAVRSIVDGHIVLSRPIAEAGRFPAVDVTQSLSRLAEDIIPTDHRDIARAIRNVYSTYADIKELLQVGAYRVGTDPHVDRSIQIYPHIDRFLTQERDDCSNLAQSLADLQTMLGVQPNA